MACRKPCPSCPWLVGNDGSDIPNFSLELAEGLRSTCPAGHLGPDFGAPLFACHQSRPGAEILCAGWLATNGHAHPGVRLKIAQGRIEIEALTPRPGWPALHGSFDELIEKLRATWADVGSDV
jgi:hypothetical protein